MTDALLSLAKQYLPELSAEQLKDQTLIPALAKDPVAMQQLRMAARAVETHHTLHQGDARDLSRIEDNSVHLVVTSPPYWTLKKYNHSNGQLGDIVDYDEFVDELNKVWAETFRVLAPGGRMVVVVGDVCLSRRQFGRHVVFPLHASIQEGCRSIGFDNLAPIIWHKIANANFEAGGGGFLGKPYEPNAVIKHDIEYLLMERKPGRYRSPSPGMRVLSTIAEDEHREWFQQIWQLPGASTKDHPAPFPVMLAERLIRMFSFVGDTVLDPFAGSGTTLIAASRAGRNSIGVEIDAGYVDLAEHRFLTETTDLFSRATLSVE